MDEIKAYSDQIAQGPVRVSSALHAKIQASGIAQITNSLDISRVGVCHLPTGWILLLFRSKFCFNNHNAALWRFKNAFMKSETLTINESDDKTCQRQDCYISIPPNGKVCPHTGLRHTHLYSLLASGGVARPFVRVVNLTKPGASKGKTLFHLGDFFRYLDKLAEEQGSGAAVNQQASSV